MNQPGRVFLLKGPPVIDGPDFAKTIKAFMDSPTAALWTLLEWRSQIRSLFPIYIAEVVEHNKRGRYPSDKTFDEHHPPNSYCVVYRFIYLYLLEEP